MNKATLTPFGQTIFLVVFLVVQVWLVYTATLYHFKNNVVPVKKEPVPQVAAGQWVSIPMGHFGIFTIGDNPEPILIRQGQSQFVATKDKMTIFNNKLNYNYGAVINFKHLTADQYDITVSALIVANIAEEDILECYRKDEGELLNQSTKTTISIGVVSQYLSEKTARWVVDNRVEVKKELTERLRVALKGRWKLHEFLITEVRVNSHWKWSN